MTKRYFNPTTKEYTDAPVGFSWTVLFFGIFVPLIRGDWIGFIVMLIANYLTGGIMTFIFPFFYNSWYTTLLEQQGFKEVESTIE